MALSKKPVNGMKDILPEEMQIRDYVQQVIKETYRSFGFTPIETPCMENIANLSNKQGGENEKLIFKVMKRGEKLKVAEAKEEADLVDFGMRYDLTVPLVRFYSNNANDLPSPFKAIQMGNVWRADRPQRGRYRQFMQCDIDIIGEPTNLAEIELILATTTTIGKLGFKNFEIRINERRILKAMAAYSGFAEEDFDTVFIILDKMDKIGLDGVAEELEKEGYAKESIEKYLALFKGVEEAENGIKVMSVNLLLDNEEDPVIWRGPVIAGVVKQFWNETVWGDVDYLFVDMPPGTGDVPLTVFQSLPVDGIVIVTSPQELVQMIVKKAYNMAEMMHVPVLGLIENFSYLKCPDCGKEIKLFGESHIEDVAAELTLPVFGKIPLDPAFAEKADEGKFYETENPYLQTAVRALSAMSRIM